MGWGFDDLLNIPTFGQYGAVKYGLGGYDSKSQPAATGMDSFCSSDKASEVLDPFSGETPLADGYNPYGFASGSKATPEANAAAYAIRDFRQMFGRNPTNSELSRFVNTYVGDRHDLNVAG